MTRIHMTDEEREAMRILDLLKAGEEVSDELVSWCLRTTGDSIGLK